MLVNPFKTKLILFCTTTSESLFEKALFSARKVLKHNWTKQALSIETKDDEVVVAWAFLHLVSGLA